MADAARPAHPGAASLDAGLLGDDTLTVDDSWVSDTVTLDNLNVVYVRRADWQSLDAHVAEALAYDLAARCAYSITGEVAKQTAMERTAEAKVMLAVSSDGTQEGGQPAWAPSIPAALRSMSR